ncbi:MAG: TIGR03560 family F420-dependent LLM class oxidoreductase [Acidimicrobiia bacterium]|nr:TIGR03560 family F420-dependent LLM class oxidoreductase [Acidimicrobiia bacterium]
MRIAMPSLVVLIGPSGAGKSTWARKHFEEAAIVSSDDLRAAVGLDESDQRASTDAFAVLNEIVARRIKRKLTTVVDTLGLDEAGRATWLSQASAAGLPAYVITFNTEPKVCRARNKTRRRPVPAKALTGQIERYAEILPTLEDEGWTAVVPAEDDVRLVSSSVIGSSDALDRQTRDPKNLDFGLSLAVFNFQGGPEATADQLGDIATRAENMGFSSMWVMDHFIQIPQVGPEWMDLPEAYTTLSFLAARTRRIKLGTLVTGVNYRNAALLGKMIATLDVLSGGRAIAGVGAGWYERETKAYGWDVPTNKERFELLEDVLELLPLMWGPGAPSFEGRSIRVPEAMCYPRPLQDKVPILVGGGGERKTLRLVAQYADAANLMGDAGVVRHKLGVLAKHCDDVGRDMSEIEINFLAPTLLGIDATDLNQTIDNIKPNNMSRDQFAAATNAGLVEDQIARFRDLADAGVDTIIIAPVGLDDEAQLTKFGPLIDAFSTG